MSRRRSVVVAVPVALAALALLAWAGGLGRPHPVRGPGDRAQPVAALPTPTPEWADSVLAVVAAEAGAPVIALLSANGDAPPRRLVRGFDAIEAPAWSADGTALAFAGARAGNWDVYQVARDGTGLKRLTDDPAFDGSPAWSPDGQSLAIVSSRDGRLAVYRLPVAGGGAPQRLSTGSGPALDPAWSPDGHWVAYAAWVNGGYRLEAVAPADGAQQIVAAPPDGADLRAPAWSPDGRRLGYVERQYGVGQLLASPWTEAAAPAGAVTTTLATQVVGFAWYPGGGALAVTVADRSGRRVEIRSDEGGGSHAVGSLPAGPGQLSWSRGTPPAALTSAAIGPTPTPTTAERAVRPGLARLADVNVTGDQINAGLAADFAALRADVRQATGRDFLGTLADGWRPLGFKSTGSAFFSWHKMGRAFDTQMELRGPGGRRDMVLVREDTGGRTMWRMYLRAGPQDGSAGRPLEEPGWTFAAGGGASDDVANGGHRGDSVPGGYWVDFTALAERHGWRRIPSLQGQLDWRRDWEAIEYWHYERRDGLLWFEAARQVYTDAELAAELAPDRLRALDIQLSRLARLGFPPGWPGEG
jgi:TolB protein